MLSDAPEPGPVRVTALGMDPAVQGSDAYGFHLRFTRDMRSILAKHPLRLRTQIVEGGVHEPVALVAKGVNIQLRPPVATPETLRYCAIPGEQGDHTLITVLQSLGEGMSTPTPKLSRHGRGSTAVKAERKEVDRTELEGHLMHLLAAGSASLLDLQLRTESLNPEFGNSLNIAQDIKDAVADIAAPVGGGKWALNADLFELVDPEWPLYTKKERAAVRRYQGIASKGGDVAAEEKKERQGARQRQLQALSSRTPIPARPARTRSNSASRSNSKGKSASATAAKKRNTPTLAPTPTPGLVKRQRVPQAPGPAVRRGRIKDPIWSIVEESEEILRKEKEMWTGIPRTSIHEQRTLDSYEKLKHLYHRLGQVIPTSERAMAESTSEGVRERHHRLTEVARQLYIHERKVLACKAIRDKAFNRNGEDLEDTLDYYPFQYQYGGDIGLM